jgi:muconolactone D-isomerase
MLFFVSMDVSLPTSMPADEAAALKLKERELSQQLQRDGRWRHLWRVVGQYSNVSIFDVTSPEELHTILSSLPLFPYIKMKVVALCAHPSSIHETDR